MKKLFSSLAISVFLFSVFSTQISAIRQPTNTAQEKRSEVAQQRIEERRELFQQKHEEIQQRIEEKKASVSARLTERKRSRIRYFFFNLTDRLEAAITRLDILIERIQSRVEKIKEADEDIDTSEVEEQLVEAQELLDEAQTELDAAEASLEMVLEAEDPKAAFEVVRDTIKSIKTKLVEVHRTLVHTIGDIKGLRLGV